MSHSIYSDEWMRQLSKQMLGFSQTVIENVVVHDQMAQIIQNLSQIRSPVDDVLRFQSQLNLFAESVRIPSEILANLSSMLAAQFLELRQQIDSLVNPALIEFIESLEQLPDRTRIALMTLGKHGWYFDLEMTMPFLWELAESLDNGNVAEVDGALMDHFRERLASIEDELSMRFPHRSGVIGAAFRAHNRAEYELSIPVFLAQIDGICFETINAYLFRRKKNRPQTATYVDTLASNTLRFAMLYPLSQRMPIAESEHERDEYFDGLNRHQVLHGEVLDYGTEINSLKSISLLNYVSQMLSAENEEMTRNQSAHDEPNEE